MTCFFVQPTSESPLRFCSPSMAWLGCCALLAWVWIGWHVVFLAEGRPQPPILSVRRRMSRRSWFPEGWERRMKSCSMRSIYTTPAIEAVRSTNPVAPENSAASARRGDAVCITIVNSMRWSFWEEMRRLRGFKRSLSSWHSTEMLCDKRETSERAGWMQRICMAQSFYSESSLRGLQASAVIPVHVKGWTIRPQPRATNHVAFARARQGDLRPIKLLLLLFLLLLYRCEVSAANWFFQKWHGRFQPFVARWWLMGSHSGALLESRRWLAWKRHSRSLRPWGDQRGLTAAPPSAQALAPTQRPEGVCHEVC